jgi:hypothetical protein
MAGLNLYQRQMLKQTVSTIGFQSWISTICTGVFQMYLQCSVEITAWSRLFCRVSLVVICKGTILWHKLTPLVLVPVGINVAVVAIGGGSILWHRVQIMVLDGLMDVLMDGLMDGLNSSSVRDGVVRVRMLHFLGSNSVIVNLCKASLGGISLFLTESQAYTLVGEGSRHVG